jgi:creatinine amidohydrolase/Fe(II)-dependent formamide hydrolase-like protein
MMFLDQAKTLIRADQIAVSAAGPEHTTGVGGNPSAATTEMGRQFLEYKIAAGVDQIRALLAQK